MAADPITAVAGLASDLITRLWPDKSEAERQALAMQVAVIQGQLNINANEAANPSRFTSGWRPAVGWVCATALGAHYILRPLIQWGGLISGHPLPELPGIDGNLFELLLGMLGLGGLRTIEKIQGAEGRR